MRLRSCRPIFEKSCLNCHSAESHRSGLVLESADSTLQGGALAGPAALPGKSDQSPLMRRLRGEKTPQMPMNADPLPADDIALIARWIDQINPDQLKAVAPKTRNLDWPWTPVEEPAVPAVQDRAWVRTPVDAFVLAKLEEKGLKPAPLATPRQLLRRLSFGLLGLPPEPEETIRFEQDPSEEAYLAKLANPHYGERWGHHWLDLVRYSDTRGGAIDYPRPHMWRYRDYVIRAFNQDRPYDRFIKEQLAGDAYPAYGTEGKLGLAYLGQWVQVEQTESEQGRRDYLVDVVDTTGSVFLGLTLGCARCHDHKYDPIPTRDYYRIESFFAPTNVKVDSLPFTQYELPHQDTELWEKQREQWQALLSKRTKAGDKFKEEIKSRRKEHEIMWASQDLKDWSSETLRKIPFPDDLLKNEQDEGRLELIKRQTAQFANPNTPAYYEPQGFVVSDSGLQDFVTTYVLSGGNFRLRGEIVKPGFLSTIDQGVDPDLEGLTGSRRKLLADWIASRDNPLTARVMVNRIWQHHFGEGLVSTPSDLGDNGAGTLHQDLLDWLAWQFMESGWSVKQVHRLILQSNVYRLGSHHPAYQEYEEVDPDNAYLWARDPPRLEAEIIRDAILATSGQLNPRLGGPPFFPEADDHLMARAATWWEPFSREQRSRRSVYMLSIRSFQLPFLKVFDGPNMDQTCVVRGTTTVTPPGVFPVQQQVFARTEPVHGRAHSPGSRGRSLPASGSSLPTGFSTRPHTARKNPSGCLPALPGLGAAGESVRWAAAERLSQRRRKLTAGFLPRRFPDGPVPGLAQYQ